MRSQRAIAWAVVAVILCAVLGGVAAVRHATPAATGEEIPTRLVKRGDLDVRHARARHRIAPGRRHE